MNFTFFLQESEYSLQHSLYTVGHYAAQHNFYISIIKKVGYLEAELLYGQKQLSTTRC